jgi:hypothetical protein
MRTQTFLLFASVLFAFTEASAQGLKLPGNPKPAPAADRVQVTAITLNTKTPEIPTPLRVRATIKNLDPNYSLSIPWGIEVDGPSGHGLIASGTAENVPPGVSFNVTANWMSRPGEHTFLAFADPGNTTAEMVGSRGNNSLRSDKVTPISVQFLSYSQAASAGAQFSDNRQGAYTSCKFLGQFNASDNRFWGSGQGRERPLFIAECAGVTGGKADPEVFKNFTLKNGWTIRSVRILSDGQDHTRTANGGGNPVVAPTIGSNNPYTKFHVWADRGGVFEALLEIVIVGPAHLSAYQ